MTGSLKKNDLYIFDLSEQLLNSLKLMSFDSTLREVEVEKTSDNDRNKESGDLQIARKKVTSNVMRCSVCQMSFNSRNEQKAHYQTDYHLMNVKRNLRGLDILSVEEFDALISKEHGIKSEDENSDGEQTSSDHEESEEASDRDPDLQTNNYMETIIENDLQKLGFQKTSRMLLAILIPNHPTFISNRSIFKRMRSWRFISLYLIKGVFPTPMKL